VVTGRQAATRVATTPTPTATEALIDLALEMPANQFSQGDPCGLDLTFTNPGGTTWEVDLYVLLDVLGEYFAYPSWQAITQGLDSSTMSIPGGYTETITLIPSFTMPAVPTVESLYFYAAMFEQGMLDLDHLASNADSWEFSLQE